MKIKLIPSLISVAISALIAYIFYTLCRSEENNTLLCAGSGFMSLCMLLVIVGLELKSGRASANVKVLTIVFFILAIVSNLIFAFLQFSIPAYIAVNGLLFLFWILAVYFIGRAKQ